MTDEELDRARANEAKRRCDQGQGLLAGLSPAILAARLAREGWMPPDPLEAEVQGLYQREWLDVVNSQVDVRRLIRLALQRGIEIGSAR